MNRFVSRKSILFIVFAWALTVTLFADAANLDDLCVGTLVLHDDNEVTAPTSVELAAWADHGTTTHPATPLKTLEGKSDSKHGLPAPARVIVDQDSPSLAADRHVDAIFSSLYAAEPVMTVRWTPPGRDALYLHICKLLI